MVDRAIFLFFASVSVIFAASVVFLRNPVMSALSLVVSFFGVAAMFVILSAPFLGVMQVLVYIGAILVLFLYITLLLDIREEETADPSERVPRLTAAVLIPCLIAGVIWWVPQLNLNRLVPPPLPEGFGSVERVGAVLLGPFAAVFELLSLVLLSAVIGLVVLLAERGRSL